MMQNVCAASTNETPIRLNVMSAQLLQRARHYRYAAALSDDPQNIRKLIDLAFMFEQVADDFRRFEPRPLA